MSNPGRMGRLSSSEISWTLPTIQAICFPLLSRGLHFTRTLDTSSFTASPDAPASRISATNRYVLTLDISGLLQASAKRTQAVRHCVRWPTVEEADHRHRLHVRIGQ